MKNSIQLFAWLFILTVCSTDGSADMNTADSSSTSGTAIPSDTSTNSGSSTTATSGTEQTCEAEVCLRIEENLELCALEPVDWEHEAFRAPSEIPHKPKIRLPDGLWPIGENYKPFSFHVEFHDGSELGFEGTNTYHLGKPEPGFPLSASADIIPARGGQAGFYLLSQRMEHDGEHQIWNIGQRAPDGLDNGWIGQVGMVGDFPEFPGLTSDHSYAYFAPCTLDDTPDDTFTFRFTNGDVLTFTVRSWLVSLGHSFQIARATRAHGMIESQVLDVSDIDSLGLYTVIESDNRIVPRGLLVRASGRDGACAYYVSHFEPEVFHAEVLDCDMQPLRALDLLAVEYDRAKYIW